MREPLRRPLTLASVVVVAAAAVVLGLAGGVAVGAGGVARGAAAQEVTTTTTATASTLASTTTVATTSTTLGTTTTTARATTTTTGPVPTTSPVPPTIGRRGVPRDRPAALSRAFVRSKSAGQTGCGTGPHPPAGPSIVGAGRGARAAESDSLLMRVDRLPAGSLTRGFR